MNTAEGESNITIVRATVLRTRQDDNFTPGVESQRHRLADSCFPPRHFLISKSADLPRTPSLSITMVANPGIASKNQETHFAATELSPFSGQRLPPAPAARRAFASCFNSSAMVALNGSSLLARCRRAALRAGVAGY